MSNANQPSPVLYGRYLILIAGLGGLLYGIDVGIITDALLYLQASVHLSVEQTSFIVAAVFGGSIVSSLIGGLLADWIGRKKMMIGSGLLFVISVGMIVTAHGYIPLLWGRLLQGVSGGFIAVVVPLYLAECLSAKDRGKGAGFFQFFLTIGIAAASLTGAYYTGHAEAAITAAGGDVTLIRVAQDHAWRSMFLSVIYPGVVFFLGTFFLSESPRWLFRKGRKAEALAALRRSSSEEEAQMQMREMEDLTVGKGEKAAAAGFTDSLLSRKYVLPFLLACVILACNQATGINSILSYLTLILRQAGMSTVHAAQGDTMVKVLNVIMTAVAVALIDRRGRKFLLVLGTSGIIVSVLAAAFFFHGFESKRESILPIAQRHVQGDTLALDANLPGDATPSSSVNVLTVLYTYGNGDHVASALSNDKDPVIRIAPESAKDKTLTIKRATYGPVASQKTGWLVMFCMALFIAAFAVGPGVVVWLALSELMPTRIRSAGMGIAMLINQGISMLIAGVFLPVVGHYGYYAMFLFWGGCTFLYWLTAVFLLPETKGRTLEEIERHFEGASAV